MKVILISGKAEAGKDSTFDILNQLIPDEFKKVRMAYGDYVKYTAKMLWGWNGKKDEEGRGHLQWWGTEYVRAIEPDFWVDTVIRLARIVKKDVDYLVVTDVRFPNEIVAWNKNEFDVITVRVERPGHENALTEEQRQHLSETALDDWEFDVTLRAKTLTELTREVKRELIPALYADKT